MNHIRCHLKSCGCHKTTFQWISHEYKTIYFEVPKAASTSIKSFFNITNDETGTSSVFDVFHDDVFKKEYISYFKFTFVRNPWHRMVSNWKMFCGNNKFRNRQIEELFQKPASSISFDEFIRKSVYIRNHHWEQNVSFLPLNRHGQLCLDFVGKLETLRDDFRYVLKCIGNNGALPHLNKTEKANCSSFYNKETNSIIEEQFKDDIKYFDFSLTHNSWLKRIIHRISSK